MNKTATIAAMLLLAISCTKPADKNLHIPPANADADYCIDLRSKPKARLVKKYRDLEPALLNISAKQELECDFNEHYIFYFFEKYEKERIRFYYPYTSRTLLIHTYNENGSHIGSHWRKPKYEISPVTQIDYPESEIIDSIDFIDFNKEYRKEDLLQLKDKIIDVEIHKDFDCKPILDTSFSIIFRARITGECDLPPLRWNIGATDKDSVIALISEETLVIRGNGKMMDFDERPWDELCEKEEISNVVIENGVTHIGEGAFVDCDLDSITIPSSVTSKADYAFGSGWPGSVSFNDMALDIVASFGKSTFSRYGSFFGSISITIPDSVFYIDEKLLSYFGVSPTIKISNPIPPRLTGDVHRWIKLFDYGTLYVPKGSIDTYRKAEGWKECKNIKPM